MFSLRLMASCLYFSFALSLSAQNAGSIIFKTSVELNGYVTTMSEQPDHKILISGFFTRVNGSPRAGICRLNPDATVDPSFDPGTGSNDNEVESFFLYPDGKILAVGKFTSFNGTNWVGMARLNPDGSLDRSFSNLFPGLSGRQRGYCAALLPDGSCVVGGDFVLNQGQSRTNIAKFTPDGLLDTNFQASITRDARAPASFYAGSVRSISIQADGKIFITGGFTNVNAAANSGYARLNSDGSLDSSFLPGSAAFPASSQGVLAARLLSTGKILVGGDFISINGVSQNRLAQINSDGTLDTNFNVGTGFNGLVESDSVAFVANSKIMVGGWFTSVNGVPRNGIARLNADGSIDQTFDPGLGASGAVFSVFPQSDGRILLGGSFRSVNGSAHFGLARLASEGPVDPSFSAEAAQPGTINSIAIQPDGKALVGGNFLWVNGTISVCLARITEQGLFDSTFNLGTNLNNVVRAIVLQADGKIVIGGSFTKYNNTDRIRVARLNSDGSLDLSFDPGASFNADVIAMGKTADERFYASGNFTTNGTTARRRMARLNHDGTMDASFDPAGALAQAPTTLAVQPDDRLVFGGFLVNINATNGNHIGRFNPDGSYDVSFNVGAGFNSPVNSLLLQPDGKILAGGSFTAYAGRTQSYIARLNPDGSLSPTSSPNPNAPVLAVGLQPDGRPIIGGQFTTLQFGPALAIARLTTDLAHDPVFSTALLSGTASTVATYANGDPLAGGTFTLAGTNFLTQLIRFAGTTRPVLQDPRLSAGQLQCSLVGESNRTYRIQSTTNFFDWVTAASITANAQTNPVSISYSPSDKARFFRATTP